MILEKSVITLHEERLKWRIPCVWRFQCSSGLLWWSSQVNNINFSVALKTSISYLSILSYSHIIIISILFTFLIITTFIYLRIRSYMIQCRIRIVCRLHLVSVFTYSLTGIWHLQVNTRSGWLSKEESLGRDTTSGFTIVLAR